MCSNSKIIIDTQSLIETVPVVGVPFSLSYASERFRFQNFNTKSLGLGGWTPSIVHHYDFVNQGLYFGDGTERPVQARATSKATPGCYFGFYATDQAATEQYNFDCNGVHLSTQDALTGITKYKMAYDSTGRLTSITDRFGNVTTITHSSSTVTITAPFGQKTITTIDAGGMLASVASPKGATYHMTYNGSGYITNLQKPMGQKSTVSYATDGAVLKDLGAGGDFIALSTSFDSATQTQRVTATTEVGRKTTVQSLQSWNQSTGVTGATHSVTDPTGEILTASDSSQGLNSATDSLGMSENSTLAVDPRFGWMAPYTNSDTYTIANSNIDRINSTAMTLVAPSGWTPPFNFTSLTTKTELQNDATRTFTSVFTPNNKTMTYTSAVGRKATVILNSLGDPQSLQIGSLTPLTATYNSRGQVTELSLGTTRHLTLAYDTAGNLHSTTDVLGHTTTFAYDLDGHVTSQTLPDGSVIHITYDLNGNVTSITPPVRTAHEFFYDPFELISEYMPPALTGTVATTYAYNLDKQLTKVTLPTGQTITRNYNATTGLLTSITVPNGTYSVTHVPKSNLISKLLSPYGETTSYAYEGNVPTSVSSAGPIVSGLKYTYDADGTLASMTPATGTTQPITYDKDGLTVSAGDFTVTRDLDGLITATKLKSLSESITNNSFGEMTNDKVLFNSTQIYDTALTRDNLGRVTSTSTVVGGKTQTGQFAYDSQGRLTDVYSNGVLVRQYAYDENGNRLKEIAGTTNTTATYDAQDRLLTYGSNKYIYSANGALTQKTLGTQTTTYSYDVFGNLSSVKLPNGNVITYVIDGQNRRVGKLVNGKLSQGFIYSSQTQIVGELDSTGKLVKQFVYGTKPNSPDYMIMSGVEYRVISDQVGTPKYVVNASTGAIVETETTDEFGHGTGSALLPFGFAGGIYDSDTSLVRFGARDYDPQTGRWLSKDPIRFAGGDSDLYSYAVQDPVNNIDPEGKSRIGIISAGICTAINLYSTYQTFHNDLPKYQRQLNDINNQISQLDPVEDCDKISDLQQQAFKLTKQIANIQGKETWKTIRNEVLCAGLLLL